MCVINLCKHSQYMIACRRVVRVGTRPPAVVGKVKKVIMLWADLETGRCEGQVVGHPVHHLGGESHVKVNSAQPLVLHWIVTFCIF